MTSFIKNTIPTTLFTSHPSPAFETLNIMNNVSWMSWERPIFGETGVLQFTSKPLSKQINNSIGKLFLAVYFNYVNIRHTKIDDWIL